MSDTMHAHDEKAARQALVRRVIQLAFLLAVFAASLFLTSGRLDWVAAWAYLALYVGLIPAFLGLCALVVRTALEDRTLREELPGYQDYARCVRYRLLQGIW